MVEPTMAVVNSPGLVGASAVVGGNIMVVNWWKYPLWFKGVARGGGRIAAAPPPKAVLGGAKVSFGPPQTTMDPYIQFHPNYD